MLVIKLHWRILSVCLSSTGALTQDCHINDNYLECRRCGFPFPCERLDKNQNCETVKSFDISQWKLILPTSNNNKPPPPTNGTSNQNLLPRRHWLTWTFLFVSLQQTSASSWWGTSYCTYQTRHSFAKNFCSDKLAFSNEALFYQKILLPVEHYYLYH